MLLTTRELIKMKIDRTNPNYWQVGHEIKFKHSKLSTGDTLCIIIATVIMLLNLSILYMVAL